jgi:zinc/manganese transport system substrate-binding protein
MTLGGCTAPAAHGIAVVGAENQYTSILRIIGGRYVAPSSVLASPSADPHEFEAGTAVARAVANARVIVQNGMGYDGFMGGLESATSGHGRQVIVAQRVVGADPTGFNPHLWYEPATLDAVARRVEADLSGIDGAHRAYYARNLDRLISEVEGWRQQIVNFASQQKSFAAAVTEPVADYLLEALGVHIATPTQFQADVMNGVDPAPQDVARVEDLLDRREVSVFCYNRQVTDSLTGQLLARARADHVPVVAVYETMPSGYDVVTWMKAETTAIIDALLEHKSTDAL